MTKVTMVFSDKTKMMIDYISRES